MKYDRYDIIVTNFPFSDLTETKKRPVMVIKDLKGDNNILCQISTRKNNIEIYSVDLIKDHCDGNIRFDSTIHLDMIFTLHKNLILHKIGKITNQKVKEKIVIKLNNILLNNN